MFQRTGIDDFTFLTRDSFLLVRPGGRFEVYDFTDPRKSHTIPTHRMSYAFPTLSEDYIYWYISMSSNPTPGYIPRSQPNVNGPNTVPGGCRQLFYPTPEDRIHACCVYILNPTIEENAIVHSFVFFVNLKTLLHPPSQWFSVSRRRKTRAIRREVASSESNNDLTVHQTTNVPTQSLSYHPFPSSSSSNSTPYPPFPTFDNAPLPSTTTDQDTQPSSSTILPPSHSISTPALPTRAPASSSRNQHAIIPWKVWGPQSTRWFEECLSTDWQHAVYGSRTVDSLRPEHHSQILKQSPGDGSPTDPSSENQIHATVTANQHHDDDNYDDDETIGQGRRPSSQRRYLRIRNFNSFVFKDFDLLNSAPASNKLEEGRSDQENSTVRGTGWNKPRLITEPSTTPVKGVFTQDIVSWLPYTEVISEETYEVTDVMMDDSRLLLLKVRLHRLV